MHNAMDSVKGFHNKRNALYSEAVVDRLYRPHLVDIS